MARRRTPGGSARWLVSIVIILSVVTAFAVYQAFIVPAPTPAIPTVTLVVVASAVPRVQTTPIPQVDYKVVSEKANLVASITNLYLDNTGNWDLTYLGTSAGYLQGTAPIGHGGNYVLAGHVEMKDGSPGPFAYLNKLKPGDLINIISNDASKPFVMAYTVSEIKVVSPTDFKEIINHGHEELTLVTCDNWDQQSNSYLTRLIVHAQPANGNFSKAAIPKG